MDPKALSHLDPKARETYDRVMGAANSIETPPPAVEPTVAPPTQDMQNTVSSMTPPATPGDVPSTTFPVTPTDFSMDGLSSPTQNPPTPSIFSAQPAATDIQSASSSFFTNPSPNSSEASTPPNPFTPISAIEPPADTAMATDISTTPTPITPYTPSGAADAPTASSPAFSQPLPSPSEVNHSAPHETPALMKVLYIVGAVIFFAIYTVFWIKVFNLPFLF